MRHRLIRVAPLSAAKIAAVMYGVLSLALVPFFMLPALFGAQGAPPLWAPILFIPPYVGMGFVMTAIGVWLYNVIAARLGGLEITLDGGAG
jgi:hypothetical protein